MGAITPIGHDVESSWRAVVEGRSGIGPITLVPVDHLPVRIAGEVKGFDPTTVMDAKDARRATQTTSRSPPAPGTRSGRGDATSGRGGTGAQKDCGRAWASMTSGGERGEKRPDRRPMAPGLSPYS